MTEAAARNIEQVTRLLVAARQNGQPSTVSMPADVCAAYAVQDAVAGHFGWFADGPARYWKSGGTSRDAVLTHAPLPPEGVWPSPADARGWPFRLRGIEAEIALRLACDVDSVLAQDIYAERSELLIDAMCVSIEVVDSRWTEGHAAPATARLADLQSHGALILGAWSPWRSVDWQQQYCHVQIGTRSPVERYGSHAMGNPAFVLPAWLRHATRRGQYLPAGTVVTTGTWVGILEASPGDVVSVTFAGIGEASVQL